MQHVVCTACTSYMNSRATMPGPDSGWAVADVRRFEENDKGSLRLIDQPRCRVLTRGELASTLQVLRQIPVQLRAPLP